jgi:hypothetical protein
MRNLAVVATISLFPWLSVAEGLLPRDLPVLPLLAGSFLWGVLGRWISLQGSAESARRIMACRW